jgi:hypothetical protein
MMACAFFASMPGSVKRGLVDAVQIDWTDRCLGRCRRE